MDITIWLFGLCAVYRTVHCSVMLYKAIFLKKTYEYFTIALPTAIVMKSLSMIFFCVFVYMAKNGTEWTIY